MSGLAVASGLLFCAFALADWAAIATSRTAWRWLTKPAATFALVGVAAFAGDMASDARSALVVAVLLCLAGDIALLGNSEGSFLAGLSAFAGGHVAYIVTALLVGVDWPRLALAFPVVALLFGVQLATGMLPAARRRGGLAMMIAVAIYSLVISTMVVTATGTASWVAAAGAVLFAISDTIIGTDRFVRRIERADLPIMVTYHVGQFAVVAGLIAAG